MRRSAPTTSPADRRLRLWPGVALVAFEWLAWYAAPLVLAGDAAAYGVMAGLLAGAVGVPIWWLFFSRAPRLERWGAILVAVAGIAVTPRFLHESVARGNMGFQFYLYAIPVVTLVLVVWAFATRDLAATPRRVTMVVILAAASGAFTLLRSDGLAGDGSAELAWRFAPTAEERLLARAAEEAELALPADTETASAIPTEETTADRDEGDEVVAADGSAAEATQQPEHDESSAGAGSPAETAHAEPARAPVEALEAPGTALATGSPVDWPGFRGPGRDGTVAGLRIGTDWSARPPIELWRRPVGPGVSSFAVGDGLAYTQEQRGEDEIVACYRLQTGEPVWAHRDEIRFWDSHVGAGPRATPALSGGRVFTLGATGQLNALDAEDGHLLWSRDAAADTGSPEHAFGFTGSPLALGDRVVVATGGRLAAYDVTSGELAWLGPDRKVSYSSPQLLPIGGTEQLVLMTGDGAIGVSPADGSLLWEHTWPGIGIVQPAIAPGGDLLISQSSDLAAPLGLRRLAVTRKDGSWTAVERWTSKGLEPSFSAFVVHRGYVYGFDGRILAAIELATGERAWKGGRYGAGELLLLPDQDLLLVVSERGELALVGATPEGYAELAHAPGIEGRTWNQPALAGDVLLIRNGEEMAAFRLARAGD